LKNAAEHRLDANQPEQVVRDELPLIAFGRAPFVADVQRRLPEQAHRRKRLRRGAPVEEIEVRDAEVPVARIARPEGHDALGVVERKPADEDRVDEGEDCVVRGNPERQRHDRDEREPAVLDEQANGKAKVLQQPHDSPPARET
jgi:hypothetical protein